MPYSVVQSAQGMTPGSGSPTGANASALTLTLPGAVGGAGRVLRAHITVDKDAAGFTTPTGWTLITSGRFADSTSAGVSWASYYRHTTAGETPSITFAWGVNRGAAGLLWETNLQGSPALVGTPSTVSASATTHTTSLPAPAEAVVVEALTGIDTATNNWPSAGPTWTSPFAQHANVQYAGIGTSADNGGAAISLATAEFASGATPSATVGGWGTADESYLMALAWPASALPVSSSGTIAVEKEAPFALAPRSDLAGATTTLTNTITATTQNRLLVATLHVDKNAGSIAVSTGWTIVASYIEASVSGAVAVRDSPGGDVSITWTIGTANGMLSSIVQTNLTGAAQEGAAAVTAINELAVLSVSADLGTSANHTHVLALTGVDSTNTAYTGANDPVFTGATRVRRNVEESGTVNAGGAGGALAMLSAAAGAARSVSASWTSYDQSFLALVAFTGTAVAAASPAIVGRPRVGAVTTSGATVAAKLTNATSVRIAARPNGTSDPYTYGAAVTPDARGLVMASITGLPENGAEWDYVLEADGSLVGFGGGRFRLSNPALSDLRIALSACRNETVAADPEVFDRITGKVPHTYIDLGDSHYRNISTGVADDFHAAWDEVASRPKAMSLRSTRDNIVILSDHDDRENASWSGSPGLVEARAAFFARIPVHPLPAESAGEAGRGFYRTFVKNGFRFIVLDTRTYRSNPADVDSTSKTMLGTTQETWLIGLLDVITEPVTFIVCDVPWIPGGNQDDHWGSYPTAQNRLVPYLQACQPRTNIVWLCGDAHMVAADDGTNTPGGGAVVQAAALASPASTKGGPYSQGTYAGSGQYGIVDLTVSSSTITMAYSGYDSTDTARITMTKTYSTATSSNKFALGGTVVSQLAVGATAVTRAYIGTTQVWP